MTKFRLDKLLSYRKRVEELISREVFSLIGKLRIMEESSRELDERIAKTMRDALGKGELSSMELLASYRYSSLITRRAEELKERIEEVEGLLEERRNELVEASRERKLIEKLKERRLEDVLRELSKAEQKTIDEVSINAFVEKKM